MTKLDAYWKTPRRSLLGGEPSDRFALRRAKRCLKTLYLRDHRKALVHVSTLADHSSDVLAFDKQARLIFRKDGKLNRDEIRQAVGDAATLCRHAMRKSAGGAARFLMKSGVKGALILHRQGKGIAVQVMGSIEGLAVEAKEGFEDRAAEVSVRGLRRKEEESALIAAQGHLPSGCARIPGSGCGGMRLAVSAQTFAFL